MGGVPKKMKTCYKLVIRKLAFPVDGYRYNAQIWTSIDGGKTFWYAGIGKYTDSVESAENYFKKFIEL